MKLKSISILLIILLTSGIHGETHNIRSVNIEPSGAVVFGKGTESSIIVGGDLGCYLENTNHRKKVRVIYSPQLLLRYSDRSPDVNRYGILYGGGLKLILTRNGLGWNVGGDVRQWYGIHQIGGQISTGFTLGLFGDIELFHQICREFQETGVIMRIELLPLLIQSLRH